jgi:hypothetical protein
MWCIFEFVCKILPGPMLIMTAIAPQAAIGELVNNAIIKPPRSAAYPGHFVMLAESGYTPVRTTSNWMVEMKIAER